MVFMFHMFRLCWEQNLLVSTQQNTINFVLVFNLFCWYSGGSICVGCCILLYCVVQCSVLFCYLRCVCAVFITD